MPPRPAGRIQCQEVGSTIGLKRRRRFDIAIVAVALLGLLATTLAIGPDDAAAAPTDRLPDLGMGRPRELVLQSTRGQRRLRFTSLIVNVGAGPFDTRASRKSLAAKSMTVRQLIYNTAGGHRTIATGAIARYAGDGHNHWHVQKVASYELFRANDDGPAVRRGAKVGFCFFDTRPYRPSLPRTPKSRRYLERTCGVRNSKSIKVGLSVGWSDIYPWNFAWQWINVTGVPAGQYLLKLTADPGQDFLEKREDNNCNWTRIRIPKTGSKVTVLGFTNGCRRPGQPPDPTPTPSATPTETPTPTPTPTDSSDQALAPVWTQPAGEPLVLTTARGFDQTADTSQDEADGVTAGTAGDVESTDVPFECTIPMAPAEPWEPLGDPLGWSPTVASSG
jgi:hypothetical protein